MKYITLSEAAKIAGVNRTTVWRWTFVHFPDSFLITRRMAGRVFTSAQWLRKFLRATGRDKKGKR